MTRDDILRMALEANILEPIDLLKSNQWRQDTIRELERFVALVTAAKDAEHQQTLALQQRSYEREIQLEVEAEREACATLCDVLAAHPEYASEVTKLAAQAIRARRST